MKNGWFGIGSFLYNSERGELSIGRKKIALTGKHADILNALVESYPSYISRDDLRRKVWPANEHFDDHAISVHVSKLNGVLNGGIRAVRDKGYKLKDLIEKAECEYSFAEICKGAAKVGQHVFGSFKANAVLTFAGHSAIFANLVLAMCLDRSALLQMPVFLAQQRDWPSSDSKRKPPEFCGCTPVRGEGVVILVPDALIQFAKHASRPLRLAVIDDVIMSGAVLACLRPHFHMLLGARARIEFVCFVFFEPLKRVMKDREPEFAAVRTNSEVFTLPWGRPLWFGQKRSAEREE